MRIKVNFEILNNEVSEQHTRNIYNHQIYSMLLNTLDENSAREIHESKKLRRLFCFSDLFINIKNKEGYFYICGEEKKINQFKNLGKGNGEHVLNGLICGGNKLEPLRIKVIKIQNDKKIREQKEYIFKTKFIVNIPMNVGGKKKKPRLLENNEELEAMLRKITIQKAFDKNIIEEKNKEGINLRFKIIPLNKEVDKIKCYARYKDGFKVSWKSKLKVTGNFKLIEFIYETAGVGENTSSGHGFVFLDRRGKYGKKRV